MSDDANVVWENTIDSGEWGCKVVRTEPYVGRMMAWKMSDPETLILDEKVGLAFDALFGPDVADLAGWQGAILGAIDREKDKEKA